MGDDSREEFSLVLRGAEFSLVLRGDGHTDSFGFCHLLSGGPRQAHTHLFPWLTSRGLTRRGSGGVVDIRTQFLLCPTAQSPTVAETLHPAFSGVQQYTGRGSPALTCGRQSWSRRPA